jgi:hypothetical protein
VTSVDDPMNGVDAKIGVAVCDVGPECRCCGVDVDPVVQERADERDELEPTAEEGTNDGR